jgi:transcription initiation factor IIE alpha subunit
MLESENKKWKWYYISVSSKRVRRTLTSQKQRILSELRLKSGPNSSFSIQRNIYVSQHFTGPNLASCFALLCDS